MANRQGIKKPKMPSSSTIKKGWLVDGPSDCMLCKNRDMASCKIYAKPPYVIWTGAEKCRYAEYKRKGK